MSQGTLYVNTLPRGILPKALIKALNLDITVADADTSEEFAKYFPLKKVPAFVGPNGAKLTEVIAITYYFINLSEDEEIKSTLLGADIEEQAQVLRWMSFSNSDLVSAFIGAFLPIVGKLPYNKKQVETSLANLEEISAIFDARLKEYTYLATENITAGDLMSALAFSNVFKTIVGAEWRAKHPAIIRWFNTVIASPIYKEIFAGYEFVEKPIEYSPPKKEKAKKQEQPKKEAKKEAKKEEQPVEEQKKPKHPLELLGRATFNLEDWKRKYSNEDTRPVALPWFWEHYNPEEYSIWKVGYKYNDELTLTFMSNNLIGGFFNRLSASTKYMFGCLVVYGENNNNGIIGAVVIRGQDYVPAFDVAPDWESYQYEKLDPSKEEDKEFINNMWAWDKPVVVNGEPKEIVDGKVLK